MERKRNPALRAEISQFSNRFSDYSDSIANRFNELAFSEHITRATIQLIKESTLPDSFVSASELLDGIIKVTKGVVKDDRDDRGIVAVVSFVSAMSHIGEDERDEAINHKVKISTGTGQMIDYLSTKERHTTNHVEKLSEENLCEVLEITTKMLNAQIKAGLPENAARILGEIMPALAYSMEGPTRSLKATKALLYEFKEDAEMYASEVELRT